MTITCKRFIIIYLSWLLLFFSSFSAYAEEVFTSTENLPIAFKGRYRSLESASQMWLYDHYHQSAIKPADLEVFGFEKSALDIFWKYHFLGHEALDSAPFFYVRFAKDKKIINEYIHDLQTTQDRYSYNQLNVALQNLAITKTSLSPGLKTLLEHVQDYLKSQGALSLNVDIANAFSALKENKVSPQEIAKKLAIQELPSKRIVSAGSTLKMLPSRYKAGEWVSLHALLLKEYNFSQDAMVPIANFTIFSDTHFTSIQDSYLDLYKAALSTYAKDRPSTDETLLLKEKTLLFAKSYNDAYATIEKKPYQKKLSYPTHLQLKLETLYYTLPLIEMASALYLIATLTLMQGRNRLGAFFASLAFLIHTSLLVIRCFILQRPPVTNMFETVIYVPWIAMAMAFIFYATMKKTTILMAATIVSLALLLLLKVTHLNAQMENVQAVLDSQYWLIIHVMMVVGSYGAFAVSGILGHIYLFHNARKKGIPKIDDGLKSIAKTILYTLYSGVALLIPGTILGGVWAAQSWGRFWDWDPKESWAFISACVYLLIIHAYTFKKIGDKGLAVGSILGLMAISFTWYGVNYILGAGLHTYGFGQGGEIYYYLYLSLEIAYILIFTRVRLKKVNHHV